MYGQHVTDMERWAVIVKTGKLEEGVEAGL